MNLKNWVMSTLLGISPVSTTNAEPIRTDNNTAKPKTMALKDTLQENLKDTAKTLSVDSVRTNLAFNHFQKAEYDMLCLIAHCEGVRLRSYWDNKGKAWTIGIGNCYRPDGKKVGPGDIIHSKEELLAYFKSITHKHLFENMNKYLPLMKMSKDEIAAVGSFLFNCGPGLLRKKDKTPSDFSEQLSKYITTKDKKAAEFVKSFMLEHVKAKGKTLVPLAKRRDLETRILFGEIVMDNQGEMKLENSVNFSEVPLGGIYSAGKMSLPSDSLELKKVLDTMPGRNLTDSIKFELNKMTQARPRRGSRGR